MKIPRPSINEVNKYIKKWDKLEDHYILQEESLNRLFKEDYKFNNDLIQILIKCSSLNDFYSTNIFSIYSVAKRIHDLKIDNRLKKNDAKLVNEIASVTIGNKERYFYSFASKYCYHHNNLSFPIYDYYVEKMLLHFRNEDKFYKFKNADLKDYVKFKEILVIFMKKYNISEFSLRDVDKYLWLAGKKYFLKKYKRK